MYGTCQMRMEARNKRLKKTKDIQISKFERLHKKKGSQRPPRVNSRDLGQNGYG